MNKEEILKIARKKYPIGTIFKSAYNPDRYPKCKIVKRGRLHWERYAGLYNDTNAVYYAETNIFGKKGTWAEIVSLPFKCYELW